MKGPSRERFSKGVEVHRRLQEMRSQRKHPKGGRIRLKNGCKDGGDDLGTVSTDQGKGECEITKEPGRTLCGKKK